MRRALLLLVCGALLLISCGGGNGSTPAQSTSPAASTLASGPPPSPGGGQDDIGGKVSATVGRKPTIVVPKTGPPTTLLTKDLVTGRGQVAGEASTVTAHLIGVHWTTGQSFYSSWDKAGSKPDTFSLTGVILGFAKGVAGMRVGGRREIVIPPSLAYGSKGSGQVRPNETLLFVVDLIKVS
jgi:peptidylprolyl isomerase